MKIKKYILLFSAALLVGACDLDTFPEGSTVTQDQKDKVNAALPERLQGDLNALNDVMTLRGSSTDHYMFGIPAIYLMYDMSAQDMTCPVNGYNWFSTPEVFEDRILTSDYNLFMWNTYYNHIKVANDCIQLIEKLYPEEEKADNIMNYMAQALASRAYDYLQLVQTYQFTYIGHENDLAVPIMLENATDEQKINNPRATVKAVYAQIIKDLNTAISYMEDYPIDRANKSQISVEVAYGLRARANLLMGNWKDAANDAAAACKNSGTYAPYSAAQIYQIPLFYTIEEPSWLWGITITAESSVVKSQIVNWPSHLCSLTGMGYTTAAAQTNVAYKSINSNLWAQIQETDVRKGWWVDERLHSDNFDNYYGATYASYWANGRFGYTKFDPYVNVKFSPEGGNLAESTNAQDWPLMRVEEMILIQAEAIARAGDLNGGKQLLTQFVKNYRDQGFTSKATTLDEFIDEVWLQRRIELWGEGFALFDILRLKKPIVRKGANFDKSSTFNDIKPEDQIMIYMIPQREITANQGISPSDNNPAGVPPRPIGEIE